MYAIAVRGGHQADVHLSRDPFGIKPLYSSIIDGGVAFSSEISAIADAGLIPRALHEEARDEMLQLQFGTGRKTLQAHATRILPGETALIRDDGVTHVRQRDVLPQEGPGDWSEEEALEILDDVLME